MTRDEYGRGLMYYLGGTAWSLVGSTYILGKGKDLDFLFFVPDLTEAAAFLLRKGCVQESEKYDGLSQFMSFRTTHSDLGEVNILVTACPDFYEGFVRSAEVCKYLASLGEGDHVASRDVRVRIHAIVRDGDAA